MGAHSTGFGWAAAVFLALAGVSEAAPESCNGIDDDGDGAVDNDKNRGSYTLSSASANACGQAFRSVCTSSGWVTEAIPSSWQAQMESDDTTSPYFRIGIRSFDRVHCGGPDGTCPRYIYGNRGNFSTTNAQDGEVPYGFPEAGSSCPNPSADGLGCRYAISLWQTVSNPSTYPWPPYTTDYDASRWNILRMKVKSGDVFLSQSHVRNELVTAKEDCGAKIRYGEGDDRYYTWETWFPTGSGAIPGSFPNPPTYNSSAPVPAWNVIYQFHQKDDCGGSPPLTFGLSRTDGPGTEQGNSYQFALYAKQTYSDTNTRIWSSGTDVLGGATYPRGKWIRFLLHVKWSTNPAVGKIELWIDGVQKTSQTRQTLWTYEPGCNLSGAVNGTPHPTYLKTGIYRDGAIPAGYDATLYFRAFEIAASCPRFWPGCP